ncbi:MAG TPA: energy transducer TonB [Phenylobacterium sp.]|jgi:protein TonB|uniref:energy transducer TonB n=1 Tax=Phenylobacterium sp. TaxID=1871053 RepID=UPI002D7633A6|nr:energy transducer TonB [Phenylobacterium sp.]HZZ67816.1 energy transducer TonB [Phenylobacterium sp.]
MLGIVAAVLMQGQAAADPMLRYYPEQAQRNHIEGVATVGCTVTPEGKLTDCVVLSEDPPNWGFGEAALKLTPLFKMRRATKGGAGAPEQIHLPIRFELPK